MLGRNQSTTNFARQSAPIVLGAFCSLLIVATSAIAGQTSEDLEDSTLADSAALIELHPLRASPETQTLLARTLAKRPSLDHHARRMQLASYRINTTALQTTRPNILQITLFDHINLLIIVDRVFDSSGDAVHAAGRIKGIDGSAFVFAYESGALAAHITVPGIGVFDIRPIDGEHVLIREIDPLHTTGRECGAVDAAPQPRILQTLHRAIDESGRPNRAAMQKKDQPIDDEPAGPRGATICPIQNSTLAGFVADDGTIVDLAVYYTPAALAAAGSVANIEAEIALAVTYTNNAYINSIINTSIRVVHKALINYAESPSAIVNLERLVDPIDGFLDSVHAERDLFGADLVSLWTGNTIDSGGVAFQLFEFSPYDDGRYGFSVMREDNATFETLAHELGHNFGCQHDRCNPQGIPFFDYGYGYRQPCPGPPPTPCSSPWPCTPNKDIMSYPPGMTVPYFSNPAVMVGGAPIGGIDEHGELCDNATAHNGTRYTVANFRPSTVSPLPPSRVYVRASAAPGGNGQFWATAFNDLQDGIGMAARARGAVTEVWVAAGTYRPDRGTNDRYAAFRLANGVTLYGGFAGTETSLGQRNPAANPTTMSGDIGTMGDASDNSYHVIIADDRNQTAILDGFIITGGNADDANWPLFSGGGIFGRCSSAVLRNCTITGCTSDFTGGGAYLEEAPMRFEACVFQSNEGAEYGGAVEHSRSDAEYVSCEFDQNAAVFAGGAVHCTSSSPTFEDCQFTGNTSTDPFGFDAAMRSFSESHPVVTDCQFTGNHTYAVAAIGIDGNSSIDISGSTFTANIADFSAGIEFSFASGTLTDCHFNGNICGAEGSGQGGAITLLDQGQADLFDCTFTGNTAGFGGGAIVSLNGFLHAERCLFVDNSSWYGGAVWGDVGDNRFYNCRFFGNTATYGGGAVHCSGGGAHGYLNSIFTGNQTPSGYGGAFFNFTGATVEIIGCTLTGNAAPTGGGGGVHSDGCTSIVSHSIVWNNSDFTGATESAQLAEFNNPIYQVNYCDVQNWSGAFGGIGNFGANPLFVDADGADNTFGTIDDDIHLQPTSPCRDAGDMNFAPEPSAEFDVDLQARVMACKVDIGADEFLAGGKHSGDLNADAATTLADLPLFVSVLLNGGTPIQICIADMNADETVNGEDVQGFTNAVLGL